MSTTWTLIQLIVEYLKKKKRDTENELSDYFDKLVVKHQVSVTGEDIQEIGRSFIDRDTANNYVQKVLQPRFDHLKADFLKYIERKKADIENKAGCIRVEIERINQDLDESNETGALFALEKEKNEAAKYADEVLDAHFSEKRLKHYIDQSVEEFKRNIDKITETDAGDGEIVYYAEKQKMVDTFVNRSSGFVKKLHQEFLPQTLSKHYPPRIFFIRFLYALCLLLLASEVGISMNIVRENTVTPFKGNMLTLVTIIYAVGISLALAVVYKILIDELLFQTWVKAVLFITCHVLIVSLMAVFFSSELDELMDKDTMIKKAGLILGFLSGTFAIANAFIFREVTSLHDLYHRMYPVRSVRTILRLKKQLKKSLLAGLKKNNKALLKVEKEQLLLDTENATTVERYVARLENINITSFWIGFDAAFAELVLNNHEITLATIKNVKDKLFYEN